MQESDVISSTCGLTCELLKWRHPAHQVGRKYQVKERATVHSLRDAYSHSRNPLSAIRFILALLVLIDHSFPLGGFGSEPVITFPTGGGLTLGALAVGGFFSLSGYLVTRSALSSDPGDFLIARGLRIFPGLLFVLALGAFAVAPLVETIEKGSLNFTNFFTTAPGGPIAYLLRNFFLPYDFQWNINSILQAVPYPGGINGSLWTLPLEVRCYILALLTVLIGKRLNQKAVFAIVVSFVGAVYLLQTINPEASLYFQPYLPYPGLFLVFMISGSLALFDQKLYLDKRVASLAAVFLFLCYLAGSRIFSVLGLATFAILAPYIAQTARKFRVLSIFKNDYSYGLYLWAFPIQQILSSLVLRFNLEIGVLGYICLATLGATGLAILSWHFIEKPSLSLRTKSNTHR